MGAALFSLGGLAVVYSGTPNARENVIYEPAALQFALVVQFLLLIFHHSLPDLEQHTGSRQCLPRKMGFFSHCLGSDAATATAELQKLPSPSLAPEAAGWSLP